jgi:hypothetical protein
MFRLALFRIRPFTAGNPASLLSGLGRGGLTFVKPRGQAMTTWKVARVGSSA